MSSTVKQILAGKPSGLVSIDPEATLESAMRMMVERNIGVLPVSDGEKLVGIISERDFLRRVLYRGVSLQATVREIMTEKIVTVTSGDTIEHCMETMTELRVRHLPVVDGGKLTGVLSIGDAVRVTVEDQQSMIEQLESYIRA
ncbi:MAG: CBS domain-containing protein [Rhodocyclaceae bacterium]|nr:CBS domain-containing protein [Rhodocyclaceae bacterium]